MKTLHNLKTFEQFEYITENDGGLYYPVKYPTYKIKEFIDDIDDISKFNPYYIGYIDKKGEGIYSWRQDAEYIKFTNKDKAIQFIYDLDKKGINDIKIVDKNVYERIEEERNKGF